MHFYAGFVFRKLARNSGRATSMLMMIQAFAAALKPLPLHNLNLSGALELACHVFFFTHVRPFA